MAQESLAIFTNIYLVESFLLIAEAVIVASSNLTTAPSYGNDLRVESPE